MREKQPKAQVIEVLKYFDLISQVRPFSRCLQCNGVLHEVPKNAIVKNLPPLTGKYYEKFSQCSLCHRIYWQGSHYQKLCLLVEWFCQFEDRA